jgi:hypothetical protein
MPPELPVTALLADNPPQEPEADLPQVARDRTSAEPQTDRNEERS